VVALLNVSKKKFGSLLNKHKGGLLVGEQCWIPAQMLDALLFGERGARIMQPIF
jgi:hypothetical protein